MYRFHARRVLDQFRSFASARAGIARVHCPAYERDTRMATLTGVWAIVMVGCAGGVAAELLHWRHLYRKGRLPSYGRRPGYWVITAGFVALGGLVAWLYFGERAPGLVAFHVGASTPLLLQKLVSAVPKAAGARAADRVETVSILSFLDW